MQENKAVLTLTNVTKRFKGDKKGISALKDVNLEVYEGEFLIIVGPSGSGKSTILRIMSGLEKNYHGDVSLNGIKKEDFSFVFQQFALLPWLTAFENVELGLLSKDMSKEQRKKVIEDGLDHFGLLKFKDSYPRELSGGMRQRVGMVRAFARTPKVVFMDEPFSEIDSFTAEELRKEVLAIWKETGVTIVMVTHLIEEALELADRIAVLTPQPGMIEQIVENTLPRPRNKRSQDFFRFEDKLYKIIKP